MDPEQGTVPQGPAAPSGPVCVADVLDVEIDDALGEAVAEVRVDAPIVDSGIKKDSSKVRANFPSQLFFLSVIRAS